MSTSPANPTPFRLQPGGALGFGDDGAIEAVTWPEEDQESFDPASDDAARLRRETISRFLDWVTGGSQDAEAVGRRCILLAYELHLQTAPRSLAELGKRLGVSKTRAWQIANEVKLNAVTGAFTGEFAENNVSD
jgi:DNA-directed RNA polymerase sigma subunit (sigma70/sigma32)